MTGTHLPAGTGVALLADVPDRERRDAFPQPVIRRKHPVVAMPVLPRRWDEIGQAIKVHVWGLTNAEIHRNRLAGAEQQKRLAPIVEEWFTGDLEAVKAKLAAAKATMPPDDWHEAGNLVLIKAQERLQQE